MTDFFKKLAGMALPFWMNKGEPAKLLNALRRFWGEVYGWITWPLAQFDPLTCSEPMLNLLAYDRDITRFSGEPLTLFRRRVAYAFVNARDSGSVAGFTAIFQRLEIGEITQLERQPAYDWDVIIIRVTDNQVSENNTLMMSLIRQYGRTCRRYIFEVINNKTLTVHGGYFDGGTEIYHASIDIRPGIIRETQQVKNRVFTQNSEHYSASLIKGKVK